MRILAYFTILLEASFDNTFKIFSTFYLWLTLNISTSEDLTSWTICRIQTPVTSLTTAKHNKTIYTYISLDKDKREMHGKPADSPSQVASKCGAHRSEVRGCWEWGKGSSPVSRMLLPLVCAESSGVSSQHIRGFEAIQESMQ